MSDTIKNKEEDPNWRTTLIGRLKGLVIVIVLMPNTIDFLPDKARRIVTGVAGLIYAVLAITGGSFQKDKSVADVQYVSKQTEVTNIQTIDKGDN